MGTEVVEKSKGGRPRIIPKGEGKPRCYYLSDLDAETIERWRIHRELSTDVGSLRDILADVRGFLEDE